MNSDPSWLLKFFDSEIHRIEEQQKKPGWTRWALMGALGTCAWLASHELEISNIGWRMFSFLLLSIFITVESLRDIDSLIAFSRRSKSNTRIFTTDLFGYHIRRFTLLNIAMYAFLLKTAFDFKYPSLPYFREVCIALYSFNILQSIGGFVISFLAFPFGTRAKSYMGIGIPLIGLCFDIFFIASLIVTFKALPNLPTTGDLRIVAFVAIVFWLLRMLLDSSAANPMLNSLLEIRRSYALGVIDQNAAKRQFDTALSGMSVADYFHGRVTEIVDRATALEAQQQDLNVQLAHLRAMFRSKPSKKSDAILEALMRSVRQLSDDTVKKTAELEKAIELIQNRLRVLDKLTVLSHEDIRPFLDRIVEGIHRFGNSVKDVDATLESLKSQSRFKKLVKDMNNKIS
jgi:hypothetical protein